MLMVAFVVVMVMVWSHDCVYIYYTGHVTIGGSICMQMLARSGWSPSNDIEVSLQSFLGVEKKF